MNKFAYDLPKDLYKGMKVRATMDTIANDIIKGPYRIRYPNRDAAFYLNSPQFLSLLQDTNVGLAEQSKQLEKQKIREAELNVEGRGGVVDRGRAVSLSDRELEDAYIERVREQDDIRQERERTLAQQLEAQRRRGA